MQKAVSGLFLHYANLSMIGQENNLRHSIEQLAKSARTGI